MNKMNKKEVAIFMKGKNVLLRELKELGLIAEELTLKILKTRLKQAELSNPRKKKRKKKGRLIVFDLD